MVERKIVNFNMLNFEKKQYLIILSHRHSGKRLTEAIYTEVAAKVEASGHNGQNHGLPQQKTLTLAVNFITFLMNSLILSV